jgi:hypothetical protein
MMRRVSDPGTNAGDQVRDADRAEKATERCFKGPHDRTTYCRLVLLLDDLAPERGAFAHALEWAEHLRLPIVGIHGATREQRGERDPSLENRPGNHGSGMARICREDGTPRPADSTEQACAWACARRGIRWDLAKPERGDAAAFLQEAGPTDLVVCGQALPPATKRMLLHAQPLSRSPALLVCPDTWNRLSRILVLDQGKFASEPFLAAAARLGHRFQVGLLVLSVARSERAARERQLAARQALAPCGLNVDFDLVVGSEIREAATSVARWRRCQLVLLERQESTPWWRWLRGCPTERLMERTGDLAFLGLPGADVSAVASHLNRARTTGGG